LYTHLIRACDIILAPVDPNDGFNKSKSPIKCLEGWAAVRTLPNGKPGGAAVIATGNAVYRLVVRNRHNGLVVNHTPDDWERAIRLVIEDDQLRARLQMNGLRDVRRDHDIAKNWVLWRDAYTKIIAEGRQRLRRAV